MSDAPPQPVLDRGPLVFALAIVLFLAALDQTVVGTALPRIAADLQGLEWYAWVFTVYMLSTTATVPIAGKLGDLHGRRVLLTVGIVEFLISSALAGLSSTMPMLIAMRALQGVGAGILVANAQAAVGDLFPPAQLSKYNGMLSGVHALASLVGPLLGGAITDAFGWPWVFLINLPVGLLALWVVLRRYRVPVARGARESIDVPGAVLLIIAIIAWLLCFDALADVVAGAWQPVAISGAVALVSTIAFVRVELRTNAALVPIPLLIQRELRVVLLLTFVGGVAIYAAAIFTPLVLQGSLGLSPSAAGLAMTPMVFGLVAGGVVGGLRVSRVGRYRMVIGVGMTLAAVAAAVLAYVARAPSTLAVAGWLGLVGVGVGVAIPALMSAAQNAVAHANLGLVTSLSKFARNLGGIVGLGVLGAIMQLQLSAELSVGLTELLGHTDAELAHTLARDPSVLLSESPRLDHPAFVDAPERLAELLTLLRAALAYASAAMLFAVAGTLALAAVLTLRLRDHELRRDFDDELGSGGAA